MDARLLISITVAALLLHRGSVSSVKIPFFLISCLLISTKKKNLSVHAQTVLFWYVTYCHIAT